MNYKIKYVIIHVLCVQVIFAQGLIGSYNPDTEVDGFFVIGGSTGNMPAPLEESIFIGSDENNKFEEMNLDKVIAGFLKSARQRLAAESSMEEKSTIIARETASMYQLADTIGLDPAVAVQELKVAFAQEYPEVVAWQYLDERIKNKTRQVDNPEWTQAQLQELAKAQVVYAQLLQLSKEKAGLSSQDLQGRLETILVEYPHFHPWIQESLRNSAFQFFKNNKNELNQALRGINQERRLSGLPYQNRFDDNLEIPFVVNLNQNQRDYYARIGLLGLAPVEHQDIVIDNPVFIQQGINRYLHDEQLSEVIASYLVSQKAQYDAIQNPLSQAEMLMRSSISLQDLAENQDQKRKFIYIFDDYFKEEIQASKKYLEENIAAESVMSLLSPDRWTHDERKKMNSTLYGVYRRCQELKQQKIDNQKRKK